MSDRTHHALESLLDPVGSRRREVLLDMEHAWSSEDLRQFCAAARRLEVGACMDLCTALAAATSSALVGLLGEYAGSSDAALRGRAIEALENVPGVRRLPPLIRQLNHAEPAALIPVIRLIGASGDRSAGKELKRVLGHHDSGVVTATLAALRQLTVRDALDDIARLSEHHDPVIQERVLEALVELSLADDADALRPALRLFIAGSTPAVRAKAAWALGERPLQAARETLLRAIHPQRSDAPMLVRVAAAKALGAYTDAEVAEALLTGCAHGHSDLAVACRMALERFSPHVALSVCHGLSIHEDPAIRREVAVTMGALMLPEAGAMLGGWIDDEHDPVVRATVIESLGSSSWPGAWDAVLRRLADEPVVAFSAIAALGNLLDAQRIDTFATLIDMRPEPGLRDAVLTRLLVFARSRPLSVTLAPRLVSMLMNRNGRGAELAAELLGHLDAPDALPDVFRAIGSGADRSPTLVEACCQTILRLSQQQLDRVLEAAYPDHLIALSVVIARMKTLGDHGPEACLRLAELIRAGRTEALAALDVAAGIEPLAMVQAARSARDDRIVPLLAAWRRLSPTARERSPLDVAGLLSANNVAVRASALDAMDPELGEPVLGQVIDMAIADADENVRGRARLAARRIVGC